MKFKLIILILSLVNFAKAQQFAVQHLLIEGKTKVTIDTTGVTKYTHFVLPEPERIVVDLYNAKNELIIKARDIIISTGGRIARVRAGQFQLDIVRVVIELKDAYEYKFEQKDKQFVIEILEMKRPTIQKEGPLPAITDTAKAEGTQMDDYVFKSGDGLSILVSPAEEVGKDVTIQPDGMITILYIGAIKVAGLTLGEFKNVLVEKLKQYVNSPKVIVTVKTIAGSKVFLTGAVNNAGNYDYKNELSLFELISQSGGFREKADKKNIKITRVVGGVRQTIPINAIELQQYGRDVPVMAGDEIDVPTIKGEIFVYGEVRGPGIYEFKENYRLVELIAKAGGFSDNAVADKVKILRGSPQAVIEVDVAKMLEGGLQQDFIMQIGDIVIVSRSGLSTWNFIMNNIVPSVTFLTTIIGLFLILRK